MIVQDQALIRMSVRAFVGLNKARSFMRRWRAAVYQSEAPLEQALPFEVNEPRRALIIDPVE